MPTNDNTPDSASIIQKTEVSAPKRRMNPVFISTNIALSGTRLKNFYLTNAFQGFVWMIFHFSVVFFFTFQLKSIILVWIFLWVANLVAFLVDIPIGILQRYYSTKKQFMIASMAQLIATGIFFSFIYNFFTAVGDVSKIIIPQWFESTMGWFFSHSINIILLLVASLCYGIAKELNDISTYSYILSYASPEEYGWILANNNITYWLWSLVGLVIAWFILSINPTFAVITLGTIIIAFFFFTKRFFDNTIDTVEIKDIVSFTVAVRKINTENVQNYISEKIQAIDLPKIMNNTKYIFLKPRKIETKKIELGELISESKKTIGIILSIMTNTPIYFILYWTISLVLIFWFWDTFATTFLIDFLNEKEPGWSYVILAGIAIPGLWLQGIAWWLAKKIWVKTVAFFWLTISAISLITMGIFAETSIVMVLISALINSIWYACGMSLGQNEFLENYNHIYAEKLGLTEIDASASAWPMKILQNLANVIWLICGGFMLSIFWYQGFFILFWMVILSLLLWSISKRWEIHV